MNKLILINAAGFALTAALLAQAPQPGAIAFQHAGTMAAPGAGPLQVMIRTMGPDGPNGQPVTGRPFSATETRHSLQILGDGTRVEHTTTATLYRDDQGRTRTEGGTGSEAHSFIMDPVAGTFTVLDLATKTAHKLPFANKLSAILSSGAVGYSEFKVAGPPMARAGGFNVAGVTSEGPSTNVHFQTKDVEGGGPHASEDLGSQTINGVTAQGTRDTITIPAGQIGNDREIRIVNERWFSNDLQSLIKSSNSDPRFGETTYELTNIARSVPDPALFQVPADYTVTDDKPRK